jgi:hypothetical protein
MITFHPASRKTSQGFVPMVTLRADKGRMVGSRLPTGDYRAFNTFATEAQARAQALIIALRVACRHPDIMTVARTA